MNWVYCVLLTILLTGFSNTLSFAREKQDPRNLAIGTYIEGTYLNGAQKKRFRGYINRTQGYAVTIVTNQLPHRRRITYQSIDNFRVKKTRKITVQIQPESRQLLARTGVVVGKQAVIHTSDMDHLRVSGTVASVTDSGLIIADTHKIDVYKTFAVSDLHEFLVNRGRTSYTERGLKSGLVAGFCLGVIFSSSSTNVETGTGWSTVANVVLSAKTAVFSIIGATTGGLIGRLTSHDNWYPVPLERLKITLSATPQTNTTLSASYAF
jgi:hypothetical protein